MSEQISGITLQYTEKDIELWLFARPQYVGSDAWPDLDVAEWIGRQYQLPSGIADLVGITSRGQLVVIEVKNVPINKAALTQVSRYRYDLMCVANRFASYPRHLDGRPEVFAMVIGPSIDEQTHIEAYALDIAVMCFDVQAWVACHSVDYRVRHQSEQHQQQIEAIAARPEWDTLGARVVDFLTAEIEDVASRVANEIPDYIGGVRLVDALAAECPYPHDPADREWQVADDTEPS